MAAVKHKPMHEFFGVRCTSAFLVRLDELAAELSRRAGGSRVSRSDAVRIAATRGIDAYAAERAADAWARGTAAAAKP